MSTSFTRRIAVAAMTGALALTLPAFALAQDATPTADDAANAGILNHIHAGSCAELGDVIFPLDNLMPAADRASGTEMATPMAAMASAGIPVHVASTLVPLPLADILAAPHAFNAHDPLDPSIYIACGDITGTPDDQGNLFVGVGEDSDSGLSGVVWLVDDGTGENTTVTVFLVGDYTPVAAPEATPVS